MLFNSYEFIFMFFPLVLIIYFTLNKYNKNTLAKIFLILASLYFYSYFNKAYLIILITSIVINYSIGVMLYKENKTKKNRKIYLIVGILFNILLLGYFKYYNFFMENINMLTGSDLKIIQIILPLGISYFTFQQVAFIVDSYNKKNYKCEFLDYCLFITFFPKITSGPIVLSEEILPQLEDISNRKINYSNMNKGLYLFSIGLAKKVLIADSIAIFANVGFDSLTNLTMSEAWLASLSYTFQLYFDFSGYCDMAIGIALMFNIILPINFNSPYKSTNIQEFWRRWHITLGRFLTKYIYIPLGGSKLGKRKTLRNLLIIFLISGIWHGAGWTFIIWGLLHGIAIVVHRLWKNSGRKMNYLLSWFLTFNLVNIFWIFFRAKDLNIAMNMVKSMFGLGNIGEFVSQGYNRILMGGGLQRKLNIAILIVGILLCFICFNSQEKKEKFKFNIFTIIEILIYITIPIMLLGGKSIFLYFNF